jgi:hypothetical protein
MNAKHPSVHDSTEGEVVKDLTTPPPHIAAAVLPLAFIVETVDLCYLTRFVVSTDKGNAFRVADFESQ